MILRTERMRRMLTHYICWTPLQILLLQTKLDVEQKCLLYSFLLKGFSSRTLQLFWILNIDKELNRTMQICVKPNVVQHCAQAKSTSSNFLEKLISGVKPKKQNRCTFLFCRNSKTFTAYSTLTLSLFPVKFGKLRRIILRFEIAV